MILGLKGNKLEHNKTCLFISILDIKKLKTLKMKKYVPFSILVFISIFFSSCQAIGDIFKTGVGVGIFIVIVVIIVIAMIFRGRSTK